LIPSPGILLTIVAFLLVVGPLVFIHELGHYFAGRLFGVKAETFSIGFGQEVGGFTDKRGTRWKIGWLPMGGYVKFAGDMSAAGFTDPDWLMLPPEERARTFQAKPVWQRAIIVAAGPVTNFVVAILILAAFAFAYGQSVTPTAVGQVEPASAAARAGLHAGDRITAIDGRPMATFDDLVDYVMLRPGQAAKIAIQRGNAQMTVAATFGSVPATDPAGQVTMLGQLGIAATAPVIRPVSLIDAPLVGTQRAMRLMQITLEGLGQIVVGERSVKQLHGPVGMANIYGRVLTLGPEAFISLIAFVSLNLGFINLLPVPMLDGGHLLFYAIEAVRRRPVTPRMQEWAFRGGLAALLALMIMVTFNDVGALSGWK
jgi:regulator of sigma E protease